MTGNSFGTQTFNYGHAKKVWREIRHRYPAGGTISNIAAWKTAKKDVIPAGTPVVFDAEAKTMVAQLEAANTANGYTQEDVVIKDATVATATVIYDGELYGYMYDAADVAILAAAVPGVKFVY